MKERITHEHNIFFILFIFVIFYTKGRSTVKQNLPLYKQVHKVMIDKANLNLPLCSLQSAYSMQR